MPFLCTSLRRVTPCNFAHARFLPEKECIAAKRKQIPRARPNFKAQKNILLELFRIYMRQRANENGPVFTMDGAHVPFHERVDCYGQHSIKATNLGKMFSAQYQEKFRLRTVWTQRIRTQVTSQC
jgi:hypothetical protein